jgi:peroxiredoxin Q/BCP
MTSQTAPNRPHPDIGSPIPGHALIGSDGKPLHLQDFAPRALVLFTYGKAGSPTCDNAIADFNGLLPDFERLGVAVLGLSKDSPAALSRFLGRKSYQIALANDPNGMMEEIGAYGDKIFMGKPVRGVLRSTYLIDSGSKFAATWTVDRVKDHALTVLDHLRAAN